MDIEDQKARDEIAFDGFAESEFIKIGETAIYIIVNYSEELSKIIRNIGAGKWESEKRRWKFDFRHWKEVRAASDRINELALKAKEDRDVETIRQKAERDGGRQAPDPTRDLSRQDMPTEQAGPINAAFVKVKPNRPLFHLALESIGDPIANKFSIFLGEKPRCYVGQVFGHDGRRFVISYLRGIRDYKKANSRGSRGIFISFYLEEGPIYSVCAPQSWKSFDRYFCRIEEGELVRMTESEVKSCLVR